MATFKTIHDRDLIQSAEVDDDQEFWTQIPPFGQTDDRKMTLAQLRAEIVGGFSPVFGGVHEYALLTSSFAIPAGAGNFATVPLPNLENDSTAGLEAMDGGIKVSDAGVYRFTANLTLGKGEPLNFAQRFVQWRARCGTDMSDASALLIWDDTSSISLNFYLSSSLASFIKVSDPGQPIVLEADEIQAQALVVVILSGSLVVQKVANLP